jgi:hypothetical protein
MTKSSRGLRLQVVGKKKDALIKKDGGKTALSEADLLDCARLKELIDRHNQHLSYADKVGPAKLARFAAKFGGAHWPQQWSAFQSGRERIPVLDKLIICLYFPEYRPQDIFPSWPFSTLTPVAKTRIPVLVHILTAISGESPEQQDLLTMLITAFNAASQPQRKVMARSVKRIVSRRA